MSGPSFCTVSTLLSAWCSSAITCTWRARTRSFAFDTCPARRKSRHPAKRSLIFPPARSTITGRRTSSPTATGRVCMFPWDRTATSAKMASRTKTIAPPFSKSIPKRGDREYSHRVCATRTALGGSRRREPCGPSSTNETSSVATSLPDYLTSVKDGGFYGWPYSYYGAHVDDRVKPPRPDLVSNALVPDYALGAHVARRLAPRKAGGPDVGGDPQQRFRAVSGGAEARPARRCPRAPWWCRRWR